MTAPDGTTPQRLEAVVLAGGRATRLGGTDKPGIVVGGRTLLETVIAAARDAGASRVIVVGPSRAGADLAVREDPPGSGPVPALRAGLAKCSPAPAPAAQAAPVPVVNGSLTGKESGQRPIHHDHSGAEAGAEAGTEAGAVPAPSPAPGSAPASAPASGCGKPGAEASSPWVMLLAADLPLLRGPHLTALARQATAHGTGAVLVDDDDQPQWLVSCWAAAGLRAALAGYAGQSLRGLLAPLHPARVRLPGTPWLDCDTPEDLRRAQLNAPGDADRPR